MSDRTWARPVYRAGQTIGAWLLAPARGTMRTRKEYLEVMGGAVGISASIVAIASCALVFSPLVNITGMPYAVLDLVNHWQPSGVAVGLPNLMR